MRLRFSAINSLVPSEGEVDYQLLFNVAVGGLAFLGGWVLNTLWGSIKELQQADSDLATKVSSVEVLVAGQYVPRSEFTLALNTLYHKLDRISDQLSAKVDK